MKNITKIFISLFYIGYFKLSPGSLGSLLSILILFPFFWLEIFSYKLLIFFFIFTFILSIYFINLYSNQNSSHDAKEIIIDEFVGIYFIFLFYDYIFLINNYITLILIFILFRFFDITKLFPANIIDKKIKNPFGVMLDDIIAAIYTILFMYILNVYL